MNDLSIRGSAGLDFIGDIHGQFDKLVRLLDALGYESDGAYGYRHGEGRRVVFVGDYIDRGSKIRETLLTVRAMVEAGNAFAIMGNHEFNAIAFATPSKDAEYLRRHTPQNCHQHEATLTQFQEHPDEWKAWLTWFATLPMWLDFGGVRTVHACWHAESMDLLDNRDFRDDRFIEICSTKGTREFEALEIILKGPEVPLPSGIVFADKQGIQRLQIRTRWWGSAEGTTDSITYAHLAMPPGSFECDLPVPTHYLADVPRYSDSTPVLIGHYWLPPNAVKAPLASNICCLDFSAGLGGPLVAYRWDGERELDQSRMIVAEL